MNLYRFYFIEKDKPISIEAHTRHGARIKLQEILPSIKDKGYFLEDLCRESVEELIEDVSTKIVNGKTLTWKNNKWQ